MLLGTAEYPKGCYGQAAEMLKVGPHALDSVLDQSKAYAIEMLNCLTKGLLQRKILYQTLNPKIGLLLISFLVCLVQRWTRQPARGRRGAPVAYSCT